MRRFLIISLLAYFSFAYAQVLAQGLPAGVTPGMVEQFKRLSPAQQSALARQYGVDPALLSATSASSTGQAASNVGKPVDLEPERAPAVQVATAPEQKKSSRIFGANLFSRSVSTFAPVDNAPVPDDYRIGPGDQLVVQLFGGENQTLYLDVSRNGIISFPNLGPINLMGLNFSETRALLQKRISEEFVGLSSVITLGNMRAINVFMAGEIAVPGAYSISALSTITQALFAAGGVNGLGSLRDIQVKRNNKTIARFDLYDLLMRGDASKDIRLNSGDVLFVPPHAGLVEISGAVKRPFIFEFKKGETLSDLVKFAGGFKENAFSATLQLERVAKENALPKVLTLDFGKEKNTKLSPGDRVRVPESSDYLDNAIAVRGSVVRPGNYQWRKDLRVSDIITDARSMLRITTDTGYALIVRTINEKLDIEVLQFDLGAVLTDPQNENNLRLQPRDEILIFDLPDTDARDDKDVDGLEGEGIADAGGAKRARLLAPVISKLNRQARFSENVQTVSISGAVKAPGTYPLTKNLGINGLVQAAGGFEDFAYREKAEYRELTLNSDGEIKIDYRNIDLSVSNNDLPLKSRDHLFVRSVSDWNPSDSFTISGEVRFPGTYLIKDGETLANVIERAGGFTDEAHIDAAIFTRVSVRENELRRAQEFSRSIQQSFAASLLTQEDQKTMDFGMLQQISTAIANPEVMGRMIVDLDGILKGKRGADTVLVDGDQLNVPKFNDTISVIGEVQRSASHSFNKRLDIDDYISLAAGFTARADRDNVYIVKADGRILEPKGGFLGLIGKTKLEPSDTIVVPINVKYRNALPLWRDVTAIIYQTVISLAALAAI
jgi:polysaccharide export outer membrane protein